MAALTAPNTWIDEAIAQLPPDDAVVDQLRHALEDQVDGIADDIAGALFRFPELDGEPPELEAIREGYSPGDERTAAADAAWDRWHREKLTTGEYRRLQAYVALRAAVTSTIALSAATIADVIAAQVCETLQRLATDGAIVPGDVTTTSADPEELPAVANVVDLFAWLEARVAGA